MDYRTLILFFSAVLGAVPAFFIRKDKLSFFNLVLIFSGAYLLSITVVHLIPELFAQVNYTEEDGFDSAQAGYIALFLLLGFLIQKGLEVFTGGVEHGHMHSAKKTSAVNPMVIVIALSIHAFMEGMIVVSPESGAELGHHAHHHGHGHHSGGDALLYGIMLHKIPSAFVLTSILLYSCSSKKYVLLYLTIFALASPVGQVISQYLMQIQSEGSNFFLILSALVAGNFLHISTTIFFEASPGHKLNVGRLLAILAGVGLAVVVEFSL